MGNIVEITEYGFEITLPDGYEPTEEFWELLPMGATNTDFCDNHFTCYGFERESDAEETMEAIEKLVGGEG